MQNVLIGIGFLIGLGVVAMVGFHLYVYVGLWFNGVGLQRQLTASGRTLSLTEAKALIETGHGTIVVDAPTLGWNVSRVWWAPEGLILNRPESWDDEKLCPDEDHRHFDHLIDPNRGVAKLICPFVFTQRTRAYLQRHFGTDQCLFVFTGGVQFEREIEKKRCG